MHPKDLQSQKPPSTYLGNLNTPVEQVLGAQATSMFSDMVQKAAIGHELCYQLHCGCQADAQEAGHIRRTHTSHHICFLQASIH